MSSCIPEGRGYQQQAQQDGTLAAFLSVSVKGRAGETTQG